MKIHQNKFKHYKNVLFFDSPFFDLTVELMRVSTKIYFTRKLSQFVKECFFSDAKVEVMHRDEKITFFSFSPAYNTIYDEFLSDKLKAREKHIYKSENNSLELLNIISNLPENYMRRKYIDQIFYNIIPNAIRLKYSKFLYK